MDPPGQVSILTKKLSFGDIIFPPQQRCSCQGQVYCQVRLFDVVLKLAGDAWGLASHRPQVSVSVESSLAFNKYLYLDQFPYL